jgi:hypothetical protein
MVFKGWQGVIKVPVTTLTKERLIDADGKDALGDGSKTTFYSRSFPIVDSTGAVTDDETQVTVYLDDIAQSTTAYTLTGAEGKIVFGTAPASGKVVTMTYKYAKTVGYATGISITHNPNLEAFYEVGSREPKVIKEGNIEITGTVDRAFVDRDMLGKESYTGELGEFTLEVYPEGVGEGKPKITLSGVKFSGWTFDMPQDGWITESSDFIAKSIAVGTQ